MIGKPATRIGQLEELIRSMAVKKGCQAGTPGLASGAQYNLTVKIDDVDDGCEESHSHGASRAASVTPLAESYGKKSVKMQVSTFNFNRNYSRS